MYEKQEVFVCMRQPISNLQTTNLKTKHLCFVCPNSYCKFRISALKHFTNVKSPPLAVKSESEGLLPDQHGDQE